MGSTKLDTGGEKILPKVHKDLGERPKLRNGMGAGLVNLKLTNRDGP